MNQESVIADIEEKARRAGISINTLCRHADVHPSTFSRWKRSARNPEPKGASLLAIGRLYDALNSMLATRRGQASKDAAA
ncbi:MAG: transposase [Novosphingobium sp.]|nr:transposase [Novosphingobium sp.]